MTTTTLSAGVKVSVVKEEMPVLEEVSFRKSDDEGWAICDDICMKAGDEVRSETWDAACEDVFVSSEDGSVQKVPNTGFVRLRGTTTVSNVTSESIFANLE